MSFEVETPARVAGEYVLRAELGDRSAVVTVWGDSGDMPEKIWPLMVGSTEPRAAADGDAGVSAIAVVLDNAAGDGDDAEMWARGLVTLTAPDGRVVHKMEAKEESRAG